MFWSQLTGLQMFMFVECHFGTLLKFIANFNLEVCLKPEFEY